MTGQALATRNVCPSCGAGVRVADEARVSCESCLASLAVRRVDIAGPTFRDVNHVELAEIPTRPPAGVVVVADKTDRLALAFPDELPPPPLSLPGALGTGLIAMLVSLSSSVLLPLPPVTALLIAVAGAGVIVTIAEILRRARPLGLSRPMRSVLEWRPERIEISHPREPARRLAPADIEDVEVEHGLEGYTVSLRGRDAGSVPVVFGVSRETAHWVARRLRRALRPT